MINKKSKLHIEELFGKIEQENTSKYRWIIRDGIINEILYFNARFKILWILKEAYDPEYKNGKGGAWDFREEINKKEKILDFEGARNMYRNMVYVSWGILNNFCKWSEMEYVEKDASMLKALKSTAYINVNKFPGTTRSSDGEIGKAYIKYRELLNAQINCFNPDVIIGGNTLHHFYTDLKILKLKQNGSATYYPTPQRLYINAYHPTLRGIPPYHLTMQKMWGAFRRCIIEI